MREDISTPVFQPTQDPGQDGYLWLPLALAPGALSHYGRALDLAAAQIPSSLARAIAASPVWAHLPATVIVARSEPGPFLALLGQYRPDDLPLLSALLANLRDACSHLRYLSQAEIEAGCQRLARLLVDRFGRKRLSQASFLAIPRGGRYILEMLVEILGLEPPQPKASSPAGEVVVVDDCALSGFRFRESLQLHPAERVIFAHLFSHPKLRKAIEEKEPKVTACVSAWDLASRELPASQDAAHRRQGWQQRLGEERYWIGPLEHVCFPWTEPDRLVWNANKEETQVAWRLIPPELCLKNQVDEGTTTAEVQVQSQGAGGFKLGQKVLYARLERRTLVVNLATEDCLSLESVTRDMWHSLLAENGLDAAVAALQDRYEVDRGSLFADLRALAQQLVERGMLETAL